jgi:timeless
MAFSKIIYFLHRDRNYLRDLIDTTNVFMKMMEKFCQGSVMVQSKSKKPTKKKTKTKPKKVSKEDNLV